MTENVTPKAWEQLPDEPSEAYARFLIYRNLGASRSLDSAYKTTTEVSKGNKKYRAPGQWRDDCVKYEWVQRSLAWDIEMMSTVGVSTVIRFINALDAIAQKSLATLVDPTKRPKDWKAAVDAINTLGSFIPAETVGAIQDNAAQGTIANIGAGGKPD